MSGSSVCTSGTLFTDGEHIRVNFGVKNERLDVHIGLAEDLISLGCYTMLTGKYLPTFVRVKQP